MNDIFEDMDKVLAKFSDDIKEVFKDYHKEEKKEEKKEPRIGALCKFFNNCFNNGNIQTLKGINHSSSYSYKGSSGYDYADCRELTKEELLEIPNIKELVNV